MTINEMKEKKQELGYSCEKIAELSGVPLGTVQKIFSGITKSPRYETLRQLEAIFSPKEKIEGEYTLEDYYAIPDERRVELIDGVIYDMSTPTHIHQQLLGEIFVTLRTHIRKKKGQCVVVMAPSDVQLDCDDKTMLQPDVYVVCNRDKILNRCTYGAPDMAVEILSPSTRRKDMNVKYVKYATAGVREYWIVDPDKRKVMVYDLEHEEFPAIYGFDASVPVRIFDGECQVDFAEIYENIKFLYDKETRES